MHDYVIFIIFMFFMFIGKPNPAIFRSSTLGQWRDRYNISWMVESHAPLEELKLYYRKLPDQLEQEQLQPLQHQSQQIPRRYPKKVIENVILINFTYCLTLVYMLVRSVYCFGS